MIVKVRRARAEDIPLIAADVRSADREEFLAASLSTPEQVMQRGMAMSEFCFTGTVDGVPVVMFGVAAAAVLGAQGHPWLIGTNGLEKVALRFLYNCPRYLRKMRKRFVMLWNYVDARNTVAITWLKWMGFTIEEPKPTGIMKKPFHRFWMQGDLCANQQH